MLLTAESAYCKVNLVTTTTDLAWAAKKNWRGPRLGPKPLLNGTENAHFVDVVPSFVLEAANADIVCMVGLDLEIGWINKVLKKSGNTKVQPGGRGHCNTGALVSVLEKPKGKIDRSMGDVHGAGNPHYWLSPGKFSEGAEAIKNALINVDPKNEAAYVKRYEAFKKEMLTLQKNLKSKLKTRLKNTDLTVIQYHSDFSYFFDTYGLKSFGAIEEKPGVSPSAGRIAEIAISAKKAGVKLALALDMNPEKTLQKFSEISGARVIKLPGSIRPGTKIDDYVKLQNHYINKIIEGLE